MMQLTNIFEYELLKLLELLAVAMVEPIRQDHKRLPYLKTNINLISS